MQKAADGWKVKWHEANGRARVYVTKDMDRVIEQVRLLSRTHVLEIEPVRVSWRDSLLGAEGGEE